ncbi:MAG TPA: histidine ammonia-lyase [Thermoanaerobaculia bacterium]|nr:histidine ammonia-lyase [Thermoanaerobaculia bacterium]
MKTITIDGSSMTLSDVRAAAFREVKFQLSDDARRRMKASRLLVEEITAKGSQVYGITTGFGVFSDVAISPDKTRELQRNLVLSHCAGVGDPYSIETSRAMMILRANALAKGYSGIRPEIVDLLVMLHREDIVPIIPSQGSVGASGDLAPLAHLASVLIGEGTVWRRGKKVGAMVALEAARVSPVTLEAKEGLALINGTQAITAQGGLALHKASTLLDLADLVGAMSLDALLGTDAAFDERVHLARPHAGQLHVAAHLRGLLEGSGLRESHRDCERVQDAYSLRCMPQVHGAVRDAVMFATATIEIEINSATDNPLIFAEEHAVISGGNFHGAPAALACDIAAIALTDLASISERRIERLVNPQLSNGLPAFLVRDGGLNSGFMIAQVTAAALVSECRAFAHPASVDSIPTSANKEDHVSMGPIASMKLARVVENVAAVLAIEAICAAQAIELRRPVTSSPRIEKAFDVIRTRVPFWESDRYLHADLTAAIELLPALHKLMTSRGF